MRFLGSLTMAALTSLAACTSDASRRADIVFLGGSVWTGVAGAPMAQGLAVKNGRVAAVGADAEIRRWIGPATQVVELNGRMVVPGFVDSHTHFLTGGFQLSSVDLRDAPSPEEFARRIGDFASKLPEGTWITGGDWDHEMWGGELPRREWIDSLTPRHPVLVSRLDGHMALANTLALELAGVTSATPSPPGGEMVRDARTGRLTGILKDEAMELVRRVIPPPTPEEMDRALDAAVAHALSHGVTQIHNMGTWEDLEAFRRAHASGRLKLRVYAVVPIASWEKLRDYVAEHGRGDDRLWWGGVKGFVDGSLGSTTAWFYQPYTDDPSTSGLMVTDTAELRRAIVGADGAGLHLMVHAIGDRANDWLLDVYGELAGLHGPRDRRPRIEHAQHLSPTAFPRFATLGVIPAMQPYHAIDDGRWAEKRIGPERIRTTYAFRSLLDAGTLPAFGSDWTVAPMDVRMGLYAAVTRRTLDGKNPEGWVPEQKITLEEALIAYTYGSARAAFMEEKVGRLEPGRYADLAVLSRNLFAMDPVDLAQVEVDLTMVEGEVVFRRPGVS